jgi:hypothetical protein
MKRLWTIALVAFAVAFMVDGLTWQLVPSDLRATDLSSVGRSLAGSPLAILGLKAIGVAAMSLFGLVAYRRGATVAVALPLFGALIATYGAYTNIAYGVLR